MDDTVSSDGPTLRKVIGAPLLAIGGLGILMSYVRNRKVREDKKSESYGAETGDIICIKCRDSKEELEKIGEFLYFTKDGMICQPCAEDYAIHYDSPYCECDNCYSTKHKNAETFEANAKTGNKVYIITRRCEDYSAYRELDMAGFGSLTEARKKFNQMFKEEKEQDYADETIADAKDYMSWGEYWGVMSFNNGEMIYELREVIVGDKGDFYFDAETFGVDVIHRKDGIEVGDNSIANE